MTVTPAVPGMQTGMEVLEDFYGIDGDDQINGTGSIYAFTENASFRDGTLNRCVIRPADTVAAISGQNVRIVNSTLDGMQRGATLELGTTDALNAANPTMARFSNINATNCHGGEFVVGQAIIDGFTASGEVTITLRNGQMNGATITQDSNVILRNEGGILNRINLQGANFDCRSSFANAIIRGGEIRGGIFDRVDFTHADISGLHIEGVTMCGNFNRASLRNMSINGDLSGFEVTDSTIFHNVNIYDPQLNNYTRIDSPDQFRAMQQRLGAFQQTADITATMVESMRQLREQQAQDRQQPEQQQQQQQPDQRVEFAQMDRVRLPSPAALPFAGQESQISGGDRVNPVQLASSISGGLQVGNEHSGQLDLQPDNEQARQNRQAIANQRVAELEQSGSLGRV